MITAPMVVFVAFQMPAIAKDSFDAAVPIFLSIVLWLSIILFFVFGIFLSWLDCNIPRDLPVRFYRQARKIVVYDYSLSLNPFARRRVVVKTFDWDNVYAELSKQAGYNGKVYMVRYALILLFCKAGTNEVVDRITLKGNDMTIKGLQWMWAYVRCYMAQGQLHLPKENPTPKTISLRRSFFTYMPYFDPSMDGNEYRSRMEPIDVILAFVMMWFFWIWLPMGLCHYIAMKCAPEPQWPAELASAAVDVR